MKIISDTFLKNIKYFLTGFILFSSLLNIHAQDLFINEFQASNQTTITDPDYNASADWIEIYNASDEAIVLTGYFITDDLRDKLKWRIPAGTTIEPGGFLIFWADARNETLKGFHTNFKLQKAGEEIGLVDARGKVIDSIKYGAQATDISYGRTTDGDSTWFSLGNPTPNSSNNQ